MSRDRHHIWHERAWYVSRLDNRFRSHLGFIATTERAIHNDLHAIIKPPIKPSPAVMRATLNMLADHDPVPCDNIPRTADFLYDLANRTDDELEAIRLQRIGSNLLAQSNLLFGGEYGQGALGR